MQAQTIKNLIVSYDESMKAGHIVKSKRSAFGEKLRSLREAAGLSQRQVARQLGITQPSYALWELQDVAIRPDQFKKLAKILSVKIEDLFEEPTLSQRRGGPTGKMRQLFEAASNLPRSQQQKVSALLQAFVSQHLHDFKQAA